MHVLKIVTDLPLPQALTAAGWQAQPLAAVGDGLQAAAVVGQLAQGALPAGLPQFAPTAVDWPAVATAAAAYETAQVPRFLRDLIAFSAEQPVSFATPGHHAGHFFSLAPAGQVLTTFLGPHLFQADVSDSVPALGDMLTHGGAPLEAEQFAAQVYGVDAAYFVTNGTTTSNAICAAAALTAGDLVLFDRNSHRSLDTGALVMTGAKPVYLPTMRNDRGMIGGVQADALTPAKLRAAAMTVDPVRAKQLRPFRLGVFQLDTYDGQMTQLAALLARVGGLCDYLLLDAAWSGYEHFLPALRGGDIARLTLGPDDPGLLVTQSVHKTMSGLAQTSQILKRDAHLVGQARYIDHDHFNHAYLKFVTTSYSYPLYASLAVNAYVNQAPRGAQLWAQALQDANAFRRQLFGTRLFRPFVPPTVAGQAWATVSDETLATQAAWTMVPDATWHGFKGLAEAESLNDPLKVTVCFGTPEAPLPAPLVGAYLAQHGIVAEKTDLTTGLFLATPGSTAADWATLLAALQALERAYWDDTLVTAVLPTLAQWPQYAEVTVRELAGQMHAQLAAAHLEATLSALFTQSTWGAQALTPREADQLYVRGQGERVPLAQIRGRVALTGALPYPPGVFVVMPGERWSSEAAAYFAALGAFMARFPGFEFEVQGVQYDAAGNGSAVVAD
ncbi:ornithine decarboxylase [Lacticaseibacillus absianus]|uniref:Orn/Lys/Arg family decarboxylase n=1 Tax=Lacticaseibacillus absianus TaxID=2729623 RepID=UPI0015CC7D93|nr:ornithine decarboxylase [Lacticaseibacillus absianus]